MASVWIPLAIAVAALAIRLPNLGWGLPDIEEEALPMKKGLDLWGWASGRIEWNPHTAGWPSLSFYVHLLIQHLHFAVGRMLGVFGDRGDYFVAAWLDPGPLLLISRGLAAAAAAAVAGLGARIAASLSGGAAALLVGGLLAASPLLVEYGQTVTPDILLALFAALAVHRILAIQRTGARADYLWAGVWIGLGISSKYTPVLLLPAVWAAHALRQLGRGAPRRHGLLLESLAAAVAAFALTSPFVVLDLATLVRDVGFQTLHMTGGHFGQARPGVVTYVLDVLGPGLGWGGFLAGVAGLALGARRFRGPYLVLAACVVPYYLGLALLQTQFPRYMLPLLLPLALGVAGLVSELEARLTAGAARRAALVLLAAIVLAPAAIGTWRYHQDRGRPSTHQLANQFLRQLPQGGAAAIAAEVLSVSLPTARWASEFDPATLSRLSTPQRRRLLERPLFDVSYLPMYTVQPEMSAFYYDLRHLAAFDYVVITDAVRNRYLADSARFAAQVGFYRDLERLAPAAARFAPGPEARGPEIRVYQVPPGLAAALERERGIRNVSHDPAVSGPLNPPDYMRFIEAVARAAHAHGRWATAARYYQALLDAGGEGAFTPRQWLSLTRMLAQLRERSGEPREAVRLYEAYLARAPGDTAAARALTALRSRAGR
jgi:hypothetical protein